MIEATFVLTVDDLLEAGKAASTQELRITRVRAEQVGIGIGLIAIVLTQKPSPLYWLMLLGIFFIWKAIAYPGQYLRKHFQKSVTNEQVAAQITEAGVALSSDISRSETTWKGLRFTIETPNTISLITIANTMYVFPKRAFTEHSCEEFRLLIAQHGILPKPH